MARTEHWRAIPAWAGYEASDRGRVRSVPRFLADGRWSAGKVLTARPDDNGYLRVTLRDGKRTSRARVHVLVALAWLGPPPPGKPQVRHLDGRKARCEPGNLAYGDQEDQEKDKRTAARRDAGRRTRGKPDRKQGGSRVPSPVSGVRS